MPSIHELIIFTGKIEHDLEHDLKNKPLFSSPKIYTADGDYQNVGMYIFPFIIMKQEE